jgi:hypothetical protein
MMFLKSFLSILVFASLYVAPSQAKDIVDDRIEQNKSLLINWMNDSFYNIVCTKGLSNEDCDTKLQALRIQFEDFLTYRSTYKPLSDSRLERDVIFWREDPGTLFIGNSFECFDEDGNCRRGAVMVNPNDSSVTVLDFFFEKWFFKMSIDREMWRERSK